MNGSEVLLDRAEEHMRKHPTHDLVASLALRIRQLERRLGNHLDEPIYPPGAPTPSTGFTEYKG